MTFRLLLMVPLIVLAACAIPPLHFTASSYPTAETQREGVIANVAVDVGTRSDRIGDIYDAAPVGGMPTITNRWSGTLQHALSQSKIFDGRGQIKNHLIVKIIKFELSRTNATSSLKNFEINLVARYQVIANKTGDIIFEHTAESTGHSFLSYPDGSAFCIAEAINEAVRDNITLFIAALASPPPSGKS